MAASPSEQRMAQNESTFREFNSKVQSAIEGVNKIAAEENAEAYEFDKKMPLYFVCECADEKCTDRISLSLNEYQEAHRENSTFTIACGHEVPEIEDVIQRKKAYYVVRKHEQPPTRGAGLTTTHA